jgi:hypothetical protein
MSEEIKLETFVILPNGFFEFICNTCKSTIIATQKYWPLNSNKYAYRKEDIKFCPICASKLK